MKLKMDTELNALDGTPIMLVPNGPPQTLRSLAQLAALAAGGDKLDGAKKFERYEFAKKIRDADDETEWTIDELKLMKDCIGDQELMQDMRGQKKGLPIVVVGTAYEAIEGK